ncbi:MAG: succinate dehydrogenase assembly factor 4 [Sneathiella sp.]
MKDDKKTLDTDTQESSDNDVEKNEKTAIKQTQAEGEIGGPKGLEPTRYGDWERKGIVSDF